jgi:peptide/nickel transport system ATP-binding protein
MSDTSVEAVSSGPLLEVENLTATFVRRAYSVRAVRGVSLTLDRGRTLGIVGESGSGKSVFVRSVMGFEPEGKEVTGTVRFEGRDLRSLSPKEMRSIWGARMAMVFQNPMTSMNPVYPVGRPIVNALRKHLHLSKAAARTRGVELFESVGIPDAARRFGEYPHQMSGGMRQRVMIATALACGPTLLIADEPTTALDVTIQAQILDLLDFEQQQRQMALVLITHDLGVVAGRTDEIAVMYGGKIVERAPTQRLFSEPRMPYTVALLRSSPELSQARRDRIPSIPGTTPNLAQPIVGCAFAPRCERARVRCREEAPPLVAPERSDHSFACWFPYPPGEQGANISQATSMPIKG